MLKLSKQLLALVRNLLIGSGLRQRNYAELSLSKRQLFRCSLMTTVRDVTKVKGNLNQIESQHQEVEDKLSIALLVRNIVFVALGHLTLPQGCQIIFVIKIYYASLIGRSKIDKAYRPTRVMHHYKSFKFLF